ncbi:hypothetical protein BU26DRAFT_185583 [Trematosphaeria pertusa]|uniref:Uncharacterized protein n=1 Tax=Trematosphaeria pertusa TaxID=390896 RepID=A0A6A6HS95_9PLEO|nr:uncharacterized protein BU26DRAFT_185583 [Trematosphaeria pertusa]KAF2240986.1 hypothetical protein BU26DRAFT_185583 [Trematosphaeria pertusa]
MHLYDLRPGQRRPGSGRTFSFFLACKHSHLLLLFGAIVLNKNIHRVGVVGLAHAEIALLLWCFGTYCMYMAGRQRSLLCLATAQHSIVQDVRMMPWTCFTVVVLSSLYSSISLSQVESSMDRYRYSK